MGPLQQPERPRPSKLPDIFHIIKFPGVTAAALLYNMISLTLTLALEISELYQPNNQGAREYKHQQGKGSVARGARQGKIGREAGGRGGDSGDQTRRTREQSQGNSETDTQQMENRVVSLYISSTAHST